MNNIKLADITMFDLANGIEGNYKGNPVKITQVGRMSYVVVLAGVAQRVGGVADVKKLLKQSAK